MRERVGYYMAGSLLLQRVVAYGRSRANGFFYIAGFEEMLRSIRPVRPHTSETIRLQFHTNGKRVVGALGHATAPLLHLRCNAEQILHVMTDFVRDDVSLREVAAGVKT